MATLACFRLKPLRTLGNRRHFNCLRLPFHHGHQRVPQHFFRAAGPANVSTENSTSISPTFTKPPSNNELKWSTVSSSGSQLHAGIFRATRQFLITRTDETDVFRMAPLSETNNPTIGVLMVIVPPINEIRLPQTLCSLTRTPLLKTSRTPSLSAPLTSASTTTSRQLLRGKGCKPQHLPADKPVIARQLIRSDQTLHRR